jgi:hypothetical protein
VSALQSPEGCSVKTERLRPGQQGALDVILSRIKARESRTAIVQPTRYGKSDLIRLAAVLSKREGSSAGSIALSPNLLLRDQLVRGDKVDAMVGRYDVNTSIRHMRVMTSASELRPFSNNEHLLSATSQLATRNIDPFCELVDFEQHRTGLPIIVHIDECHETSENKRRGELVQRLEAAGALIVLYTATAIRADGEMIPGFRAHELDRNDVKRYVVTDAGDDVNNRIDVYEGQRCVVELLADHTTSFQQAWNEKPSPLCNLSREVIDVYLNDISAGDEHLLLSQCSPSKARQYLSKAVRNPVVIEKAVELFVRELDLRQRVNPDAAGIVFSCNDLNEEANKHAKEIAAAITLIKPDYQCCIVTMKSDEGDEASTKQIMRFVGVDGGTGKGDVLIVKFMGGVGLDAARVKVGLDLSSTRTVASVIQRIMRAATPWAGMRTASIITLADPLMDAIWHKYVIEEGGEAPTSTVDVDMEWKDFYFKPKEERDTPLMEIVSADIFAFDDNRGQIGNVENLAFVNELLGRIPTLAGLHTKAELSELLAGFSAPVERMPTSTTTLGATIASKQAVINTRVKELANRDAPYNPKNSEPFRERCRFWMNRAKTAAVVPLGVKLEDIVNTSTLDVMVNFLAR